MSAPPVCSPPVRSSSSWPPPWFQDTSLLRNKDLLDTLFDRKLPPVNRGQPLENRWWCDFLTQAAKHLQNEIHADNISTSRTLSLESTRTLLVNLVNSFDRECLARNADTPKLCLDSCPGPPTPIPAVPKLVSHKAVETEPLPPSPAQSPKPTFADVVMGNLETAPAHTPPLDNPTRPPPAKPRTARKGPQVLNPVRLIVRPSVLGLDKPFASLLCFGPSELFRRLSHAMLLNPSTKDTTLLGVHRNRKDNLIVSLPHDTSDSAVAALIPVIGSVFQLKNTPISVSRDTPWVKVMVSSVPARPVPEAPTYSEEEVRNSFLLNPAVKQLSITQAPRWIRSPASITGAHSSFTFSFEDSDGSLAQAIAKSRLFMFGEPVHLKRWTSKPRPKQDQTRMVD
ncbi:hypothetical protein FRC07_005635 [Ceratobasidium sp. 392]|nr:hypothetical protein FRC07_005635 [Ceratobasidium sp. 392]